MKVDGMVTVTGLEMRQQFAEGLQMMSAKQIARELFSGNVTAEWVLKNVPGRRRLGHRTVLWVRSDVEAWIKYATPNAE